MFKFAERLTLTVVFFPGTLIALIIKRNKGSLLYRRTYDSFDFLATAVGFSGLFYLALVSMFLGYACGPLGSDLDSCHAPGNAMAAYATHWPLFLAAQDAVFLILCSTTLLGCALTLCRK